MPGFMSPFGGRVTTIPVLTTAGGTPPPDTDTCAIQHGHAHTEDTPTFDSAANRDECLCSLKSAIFTLLKAGFQ